MNPIVAIVIVVIVCAIIIIVAKNSNRIGDDDSYHSGVVEETIVTEHYDNAPPGQVFAPGTNPPGTALCNVGHIFQFMTGTPYPEDS